jgi:hypothetical protein
MTGVERLSRRSRAVALTVKECPPGRAFTRLLRSVAEARMVRRVPSASSTTLSSTSLKSLSVGGVQDAVSW